MLTVYRASAGAGKTHTLTGEYLKMLFGGKGQEGEATYRHILAVTFTNKATAEMKDRIVRDLYALASGGRSGHLEMLRAHLGGATEADVRTRARTLLVRMLHDYAAFNVSTIDHFFQQTLRAFVREIGLQGNYVVELDAEPVLDEAVDSLLAGLDREGGDSELFRWLLRFSEQKVERGETWVLSRDMKTLGRQLFNEHYKALRSADDADETAPTVDRKKMTAYSDMLYATMNAIKSEARELGERGLAIMARYGLKPESFKWKDKSGLMFFNKLQSGVIDEEPGKRFCQLPDNLAEWVSGKNAAIEQAYADGLNDCVKAVLRFYDTRMRDYLTAQAIAANFYTLGILGDIAREIRRRSDEKNRMLIADTAELLTRIIDGSDVPFIYEKTGTRIRHYLIDEFQDTSALQWRNFRPLVADSLGAGYDDLIVGDVKQSIYRFRNSDWTLLDERIGLDFPTGVTERTLAENWRSFGRVVEFNNALFTFFPARLQERYNVGLAESTLPPERCALYGGRILRAYAHSRQALPEGRAANAGHVRVELLEHTGKKEEWQEQAMARLVDVVSELRRHGRSWGDIAVLTRTRAEAALVTGALLTYGRQHPEAALRILSDDGLQLDGASAVRFIVGMLRYMNRPDDSTLQRSAGLLLSAMRIKRMGEGANPSLVCAELDVDGAEARDPLLAGHRSIYEAVEAICRRFGSDFPEDELIFVQSFLDLIADYAEREGSDVDRFLSWWKDTGSRTQIAMPETQDALRVMTIHKAKGLGFDVVVLPFSDWGLDAKSETILWCRPRVAPFDAIGAVPVNYKAELSRTIFSEEYYHEKLHAYIDALNTFYVALTRAKEELILFTPAAPPKKDAKKDAAASIADILREALTSRLTQTAEGDPLLPLADGFRAEDGLFEWGTWIDCEARRTDEPPADTASIVRTLPSVRPDARMYLSLSGRSFDDTQRDYGVLMHDLLSHIRTVDDLPAAVAAKVSAGEIGRRSADELEKRLRTLLDLPAVRAWFDGSMTVLTEAEILSGDGRSRRPDRVMLATDDEEPCAVIVDYKFGLHKSTRYARQIRDYMALLGAMGYANVRGYLWYVELGETEEVSA